MSSPEKTTDDPLETLTRLNEVLETSVMIKALRETKASPETVRAAAHIMIDRALDQAESA